MNRRRKALIRVCSRVGVVQSWRQRLCRGAADYRRRSGEDSTRSRNRSASNLRPPRLNPEVAGSATANAPATALAPVDDVISACEIVELRGAEITFRVHYRINAGRSQPIWAGAWLYDASGRSIDAGYKPVAIPRTSRRESRRDGHTTG